ncbi:MAG: hypothetical protein CVV31_10080 [Methanomicrobiales archaeon HGW-Methanomicrobiales-2]|nr:MAG: hypothetical protein CVV31_10080 [Methanomicrobiales archaeon HGW-Methanomicrobiales-2]
MKRNKLSAPVYRNGFPLASTVFPVNVHDSQFYEPKMEAFETPGALEHPLIISQIQPTISGKSASTTGNEE